MGYDNLTAIRHCPAVSGKTKPITRSEIKVCDSASFVFKSGKSSPTSRQLAGTQAGWLRKSDRQPAKQAAKQALCPRTGAVAPTWLSLWGNLSGWLAG